MTSGGHRLLVVEDRPADREMICEILRLRGDSPREAANVEEALAAIAEEEFCGFVLDQALPLNQASVKALIAGGERVTVEARKSDKRRADDGAHVTPIVALTSQPLSAQFISGLFERGIDAYVEKPVEEHQELFLEKLRTLLARAGRGEHAMCAALAVRRPVERAREQAKEGVAGSVRLVIDGKVVTSRRTGVLIDGVRCEMKDLPFLVVLRCAAARERSPEAWSSREALGIAASRNATTYVREAFAGFVAEGFQVIESDGRGSLRLNPRIVVERIDWDVLAEHPDPGVARVAIERRKRRSER